MNPLLARLHPYPFERLRALMADTTPSPAHSAISLGLGEPRHATPALIEQALIANLKGLSNYPATAGEPRLREAITGWVQRRYGVTLDAATQVLPVNGSREALFALAQTLIDPTRPGATVVCPNPFYQIYEGAAYLSGVNCPNQCGTGATSLAGVPVGIEANYSRISGTITVDLDTNTVTAASLTALDPLSLATFQTDVTVNDMVVGNPALNGHVAPFTGTPLNLVTWTFSNTSNALGLQMAHQAGGGTAATSSNVAACVPVALTGSSTTAFSGQCGQLAAAVNASGATGQTTINNSFLNWTGVAANYVVRDATTVPWWTATTQTLTVSGAAGLPGITWDLSGFTGPNSVIKAYTTADSLSGNSAAAISATYTLQVVPVPAAVWLFGSAFGLLGVARRLRA